MSETPSGLGRGPVGVREALIGLTGSDVVVEFGRELLQDRLLYLIIGGYAVSALLLGAWLGVGERMNLLIYLPTWLLSIFAGSLFYVLLVEIPAAIRSEPTAPITALSRRLAPLATPRAAASLILIVALGFFMGVFTSVKTILPFMADFSWDATLAELDAALHGGVDPWRLLHPLLGHPRANEGVEFLYAAVWMILTCGGAAWVAGAAAIAPSKNRLLTTFLLSWILLGNLMAGAVFSAGPAFYEAVVGSPRFAELVAYHASQAEGATSAHTLQTWLWAKHQAGEMQIGTGISAFPSMHVSMATLTMIAAFCAHRNLGYLALLYLAAVMATSVHLGWHYAVDGYVSVICTLGLWLLLKPLQRQPPSRDGVQGASSR
jgi:hypothetical protein